MTKYRSKFEAKLAPTLNQIGEYETVKLKYIIPASTHVYTPDWKVGDSTIIEVKGKLDRATVKKMEAVRQQYPDLTIVFVFQNSSNKMTKRSKTTYKQWAINKGFIVVEPSELQEWVNLQKK
jgi:hypothetical protein